MNALANHRSCSCSAGTRRPGALWAWGVHVWLRGRNVCCGLCTPGLPAVTIAHVWSDNLSPLCRYVHEHSVAWMNTRLANFSMPTLNNTNMYATITTNE